MSSDVYSDDGSMYLGSDSEGEDNQRTFTSSTLRHSDWPERPRLTSPRLLPRERPYTLPALSQNVSSQPTQSQNLRRNNRDIQRQEEQRRLRDSMQDVVRATERANRAVQTAQEALNPASAYELPPIVDLTRNSSSRSPEVRRNQSLFDMFDPDGFLSNYDSPDPFMPPATRAPPFPPRQRNQPDTSMREYHPPFAPPMVAQSLHYRRSNGSSAYLPFLEPPPPTAQQIRIQDERAVQRQREARALWNSNQRHHQQSQNSLRSIRNQSSPTTHTSSRPSTSYKSEPIESVDLTQVDDAETLNLVLAQHRRKISLTNPSNCSTNRTPLTSYKCPICMETPTDATTTICGHLFCHRCIIETLKWSEEQRQDEPGPRKPKGVCPVCRTPMDRKDVSGQGRTLVPLEMLVMTGRKRKRIPGGDGKENIDIVDINGEADIDEKGKGKGKKRKDRESTDDIFRDLTTI